MHKARYSPYILPFFLIPCAIYFFVQGFDRQIDVIYCINLLCGGLVNVYLVIYQIYYSKKKREIPRNPTWVYWLNLLTVFQLWPLIPLYLHLPVRWANRIDKFCRFVLIAFAICLVISVIYSLLAALL